VSRLKKASVGFEKMFEEVPIVIKNSHLISVLLWELQDKSTAADKHELLNLSSRSEHTHTHTAADKHKLLNLFSMSEHTHTHTHTTIQVSVLYYELMVTFITHDSSQAALLLIVTETRHLLPLSDRANVRMNLKTQFPGRVLLHTEFISLY